MINTPIKLATCPLLFLIWAISASGQMPAANFTAAPIAGCSPLVVSFTDQSTGSPTAWVWDFGNGATSTLQNPTTTFFVPGKYNITLTVTNAAGTHTLTRSQYITVYEPPVVDFSGFPNSGCFPVRTQFTDLSTAGIGNTNVTWVWDFGNGTQSGLQNPYVVFTTAGNFTVSLKVTNDKGCSKIASKPNFIQVAAGVTAAFTNDTATSCRPPSNINFTNTSTGPGTLSYSWNFGDGGTSTLQNPTHTFLSGGPFTVTLVTTSNSGCVDSVTKAINITNNIIAINAPDSVCVNSPANFQNTSNPLPAVSFWDFDDGSTSTLMNPVKTYASVGVYNVKLVNNYPNCRDSVFKSIRVLARPVADFTAPVTSRCQPPLTVNFQDISNGAVSWQWNFGDGAVSTLQNPVHTYNSYGSFDVTLIITNASGCTDTIVKPQFIRVNRAQITIPIFPARGCVPYTINPVASINAVDAVTSYFWDFGDGFTSTSATPSHTYPTQGTYTVKLVITTSTGCTDSIIVPGAVRVGTKPTVNFTAAPIPACASTPVQFTDLTSQPVDQWFWTFGDGTSSSSQNPTHLYSDTGYFSITLVATNNGCPDSLVIPSYVYILPPVARYVVDVDCSNPFEINFEDQSVGPVTNWLWDFGDGTTSTAQHPSHTYTALGSYSVTLTVSNSTCTHSTTHIVHVVNESPDFAANTQAGCKSLYIVLTTQNFNINNIASYSWSFDGITFFPSTSPSAFNFYNTAGTYTAALITTDIYGCLDTIIKPNYIRVNGPTANFSGTNTSGCKGLTTTFNDLSVTDGVNQIVRWQWDFGDGVVQTFTAPPFQHTYILPGSYDVKLKITDAFGCTDSLTILNFVIATDPNAFIHTLDTMTCPGANVQLANQSTPAGFTSFWDFGDGSSSTNFSENHSFATAGDYIVKLVITDQYGCRDSMTRNIHVQSPVSGFSVNDSVSSCVPFEVDFTNSSQYYNSLLWNFGQGGTSTMPNPIVYYSIPGTYIVKLYATSPGGCVDSAQKTIIVYDTTGSNISYSPLNGCKPLQINLNAFTPGPVTYIWDYGDGNVDSSLTPNVTHIYDHFGDFIPKVILKDPSGCIIPLTGPDTVRILGADANFGFNRRLFCDSGFVSFTDSSLYNDTIAQYSWDFGDGTTSNVQNPVHHYIDPGLYTVSLVVQTLNGCRDSLMLPDTIRVIQSPLIDIGGDTTVCVNDPMLLNGLFLQPDTSIVGWNWVFPNGNTSNIQFPPQQFYPTAGNFVVTTIASNSSGCIDSSSKNITIYPLPTVSLPGTITMQAGFPVTLPAIYSPNTVSYSWSPAATLNCTTCPQPVASPKFNTNYTVAFLDTNGCRNLGTVSVIVICKNANVFMPNTFSPNGDGVNDVFYPRGVGINRAKLLRIFDRWGEIVFESKDFSINDQNYGWNGNYKGHKPQAGVYVYQVEFYCDNGDLIRLEGNIALIL